MHVWFGQAHWLPRNQHSISMTGRVWRGKIGWKVDVSSLTNSHINSKFPYESSKWACDLISIKSNDRYSSEKHHIISFTTSPGVVASAIIDLPLILAKLRVGLQYVVRSWCLPSLSHAKSLVLVPVSWCVIADYHRICSCYFQCLCCPSAPKSTRLLVSLYFIGRSLGNSLCRSSHDSWLWSHHSWKVIATLRTRLSSSKTTSAISQEIDAMTSIIPKPPSSLEKRIFHIHHLLLLSHLITLLDIIHVVWHLNILQLLWYCLTRVKIHFEFTMNQVRCSSVSNALLSAAIKKEYIFKGRSDMH